MLLQPYRVHDLMARDGTLCAQILGELGADLIQIGPPGGAPGRYYGPLLGDRPDPEASLGWWAYARGKCSVSCLDETALISDCRAHAGTPFVPENPERFVSSTNLLGH